MRSGNRVEIYVSEQEMMMVEELRAHGINPSEVFKIGLRKANRKEVSRAVIEAQKLPAIATPAAMLEKAPLIKESAHGHERRDARTRGHDEYHQAQGFADEHGHSKKDLSNYTLKSWMNIKTYKEAIDEAYPEKPLSEVLSIIQKEERTA